MLTLQCAIKTTSFLGPWERGCNKKVRRVRRAEHTPMETRGGRSVGIYVNAATNWLRTNQGALIFDPMCLAIIWRGSYS